MGERIDLRAGNGNGSPFRGAVVLGREYRITLEKEYQAVLEQVARFNGSSPTEYLTHATKWTLRRAHYEIASALAVQGFLDRFPFNCR